MPEVSLQAGETASLLTLDRFQAASVRPTGGDIRVGKEQTSARRATLTSAGDRTTKVALEDGETLYAYAEEDTAVEYRREGFLDILFPRKEIDMFQQSASSITEVNADQTADVPDGDAVTTTVRADAGEVWRLKNAELYAHSVGSVNSHWFDIATETEDIAVAKGESDGGDRIRYRYGGWDIATRTAKGSLEELRIDENDGMDVTYLNNTGATQTQDRQIRLQFEVTKVA